MDRARQIVDGYRSVRLRWHNIVARSGWRNASTGEICRQCGTVVEKRIVAQVFAGCDVVGGARIKNHKRIEPNRMRKREGAGHNHPVPDIEVRSSVVRGYVVLV